MFKIRGEEEEEAPFKIVYRRAMTSAQTKISSQELLFKLLELRVKNEVDGEAYFELLKEYYRRAVKTSLDMERFGEYIGKLELLGDLDTLKVLREYEQEVKKDV